MPEIDRHVTRDTAECMHREALEFLTGDILEQLTDRRGSVDMLLLQQRGEALRRIGRDSSIVSSRGRASWRLDGA